MSGRTRLSRTTRSLVPLLAAALLLTPAMARTGSAAADAPPDSAQVNNVTLAEGNSGTTNFVFTITGSCTPTGDFVCGLNWSTHDGTATAGSDYTQTTGSLTNLNGAFTQTVTVPVTGDTTYEPDEDFTLHAVVSQGSGSGGSVTAADGTATIVNDDTAAAAARVTAYSGSGQSARPRAPFTQPLVARVATTGGTAVSGAPVTFTVVSGSARFPGGTSTALATTAANGRATAPTLTAGPTPGPVTVRATAPGVTGAATFTETVLPAPKPVADLTVALSAPQTAHAGTAFVVSLTVTNKGPATAPGVTTDVNLPAGLVVSGSGGGHVTNSGRAVRFVQATLAPGHSVTYKISVTAARTVRGARTIALGTGATGVTEPTYANNAVSRPVTIGSPSTYR